MTDQRKLPRAALNAAKRLHRLSSGRQSELLCWLFAYSLGALILTVGIFLVVNCVSWNVAVEALQQAGSISTASRAEVKAPPPKGDEPDCHPLDRARFALTWDAASGLLKARVIPTPYCGAAITACPSPNPRTLAAPDCGEGDVAIKLQRGLVVVADLGIELPIEAAMRNYEFLVTAGAKQPLVQCNMAARGDAKEQELCAETNRIEREFSALVYNSPLSWLRSWNGWFQFITVWTATLLVLWYGMRARALITLDKKLRQWDKEKNFKWHNVPPQEASTLWAEFVERPIPDSGLTGATVVEGSAWLAAQGALIAARNSGQDAREAVSEAIQSHLNMQEAASGLGKYLIYAIPSLGFLGTVWGLRAAMSLTAPAQSGYPPTMAWAKSILGDQVVVAFDTTMFALIASLVGLLVVYIAGQLTDSHTERVRSDLEAQIAALPPPTTPVPGGAPGHPVHPAQGPSSDKSRTFVRNLSVFLALVLTLMAAVYVLFRPQVLLFLEAMKGLSGGPPN